MSEEMKATPAPAPKDPKRTTAIIATVATAVLCGCPGLLSVCWGGLSAIISFIPGATIDIGGSSDPTTAALTGLGALCGGILFVAIPIVVGVLTLRKKKAKESPANSLPPSEPLPPAS